MLFPGITCYCVIAVFFFLKEKDLVHMLFKEYVPRFSHPKYQNQPYLQLYKIEMQPGRQYMTQMGCLELKGMYGFSVHVQHQISLYSCIFIQSVRNSFYGVLLDRLHKLKQILKVPSDWSVNFSVYFKSFRILRKLNSYKNKVCR